ncbi:uncharacterized protein LOC111887985 [Lactuca sativa]|uniref:Plant bHLH transcription factor ACT-like domain-containing protein n=1 Tax=Lactuca sativa TaxID=4236 RepID=A0A9R1VPE3_LACSA|nr:uncharacterized protein LOC111887985 [Lactuca sativa]KAJ0208238.1 hypothetical protein LSAT_V11C500283340 [Lactuca sativa]
MGSKEEERSALYQKIKQLRSLSHSNAVHKTSIIVDASKYIEELKKKVERLNEDITSSSEYSTLPMQVRVETLDKGFRINVYSEEDCPGLLVSILEAFEELGLDVCDAAVSSSNKFHLQAISENEGHVDDIDAHVVKQAILKAIKNTSERNNQD